MGWFSDLFKKWWGHMKQQEAVESELRDEEMFEQFIKEHHHNFRNAERVVSSDLKQYGAVQDTTYALIDKQHLCYKDGRLFDPNPALFNSDLKGGYLFSKVLDADMFISSLFVSLVEENGRLEKLDVMNTANEAAIQEYLSRLEFSAYYNEAIKRYRSEVEQCLQRIKEQDGHISFRTTRPNGDQLEYHFNIKKTEDYIALKRQIRFPAQLYQKAVDIYFSELRGQHEVEQMEKGKEMPEYVRLIRSQEAGPDEMELD